MQYAVKFKQFGEGCDYTIACGQRTIVFSADSDADAIDHVTLIIRENYGYEEARVAYVDIYRIESVVEFDLDAVYNKINADTEEEEALAEVRRAEKALAQAKAKLKR